MKKNQKLKLHLEEENELAKSSWEKYGLEKGTIIAGFYGFLVLIIVVFSIEHFPFFKGSIIVSIIKYFLLFCFFILYYSTIFNHLKILSVMRRISKDETQRSKKEI